jgi:hypothetical protein
MKARWSVRGFFGIRSEEKDASGFGKYEYLFRSPSNQQLAIL